jgi:hypothetical protein
MPGFLRLVLFFGLLCVCLPVRSAGSGSVWVFGETQFPRSGSAAPISSKGLVAALGHSGVEARAVDARGLENALLLEDAASSVVVLASGNVFPKAAFPNLQEFHKRGGSFVLSGVPFTHPCVFEEGKWKDLGHEVFFAHRKEGIGTGGFRSAQAGLNRVLGVPASPVLLPEHWFAGMEGPNQWLDVSSFDPLDEVLPLLNNVASGQAPQPVAACIRHRCELFSGACDVWLGHSVGGEDERDVFLATQLLVRGVLWCLNEKHQIPAEHFAERLDSLNRATLPGPLPGGLHAVEFPRPWGSSFVPKSKPPSRRLSVVSLDKMSKDARIAVGCLQGLTSRAEPQIWLVHTETDRFWLDWHQKQGHIDGFDEETDWPGLFQKHRSLVKGAVIADPGLYSGDLLAVNVAACEDWIVASPELARTLGLKVRLDMRGRFKTYAQGLDWLWMTYKDRFNRHLCDYMHPGRLLRGNFAYAYQWKAPMLWISGRAEEDYPGADRGAEKRAVARIFAEMPVNIPVFGFPAAGEGVGIGEPPGVALASRYGKGLVCTDHMLNAGVMSGVSIPRLTQLEQPPAPALERDKIYVALVMSDGDNQNAWHLFFRRYFESPGHGRFPLAFGIGPAILELQPAVAQWYYQRATPTTEFVADVSGASYMQPDHWGEAYLNREEVLSGFLKWTAKLLPPLGLRTVRTVHGEDPFLSEYAKALPFCHSLLADMGCYSGHKGYGNLTYDLPGGMPVFRAVTTWRNFGTGFLGEIREQVGNVRPAFVNGFVHCWTFQPKDLEEIVRTAGEEIVFVTPSQLAALYRQAGANTSAPPTGVPRR